MKYAFIFGTSAFVVPHGVILYADEEKSNPILKINSISNDTQPGSFLSIDLEIKDTNGNGILLSQNKALGTGVKVYEERKTVKVYAMDGTLIIKVQQLDEDAAMSLELNITAELEVNAPVTAIRVFGEFMVHDVLVRAENEKLHVGDDIYATAALAGSSLRFTPSGVNLQPLHVS